MIANLITAGGLALAIAGASPLAGGGTWSLTLSPAKTYAPPASTSVQIHVRDSGTIPLKISMDTAAVRDHHLDPADISWAAAAPGHFTLQPGQTRTVTVTLKGASPQRPDVAVIARATRPGQQSNVKVVGSVASRVTFHPITAPSHGLSPTVIGLAALAALLALAALIALIRRYLARR